jgi:hypothetical protein
LEGAFVLRRGESTWISAMLMVIYKINIKIIINGQAKNRQ